jgi:hypothetical protein
LPITRIIGPIPKGIELINSGDFVPFFRLAVSAC